MKYKKAVKRQIKEIIETTDWREVSRLAEAWCDIHSLPAADNEDWTDIGNMKQDVKDLLKRVAKECKKTDFNYISGRFYTAMCWKGKEDGSPWVRLQIFFGQSSMNDGEEYEED